ncbi:MAG TPA: CBS domain-containing protein [Steroidobacteraceae bacterium]|nr:CBS domain-containing protein [Steroidobacteraceae bacterium]
MNLGQIATKGAVTASPATPLLEVARLMLEGNVGAVVITKSPLERPVVVGIVTDRDIVRTQFHRAVPLSSLHAEDAMTRDPLVLNEDQSIGHAIGSLQARGVRRAPVVNASGMLSGLISSDDLLARVSDELTGLSKLVSPQAR